MIQIAHAGIQKELELQHSKIHGKGIFAKENIPKGSTIGIFTGKFFQENDRKDLSEYQRSFLIPIDSALWLGPEDFFSIHPLFYINHSCEPSAVIHGNLTIVALKDIQAGEEITIDYATIRLEENQFLCNCHSPECRNLIQNTDILIPELQKKYQNYISPWIQRKLELSPETIANQLQFESTGAWGLVTALDLHDCNPEIIRNREAIYEYTIKLCEKIKVKRFGEPIIVHFGEDERVAGYSLVQLIETSLISGHFANLTNRVYLDIFSCAYYNPVEVIEFSKRFYQAKDYHCKIYLRH